MSKKEFIYEISFSIYTNEIPKGIIHSFGVQTGNLNIVNEKIPKLKKEFLKAIKELKNNE